MTADDFQGGDDGNFIVDDEGHACQYDDEDEEGIESGKKPKLEVKGEIVGFLHKMALAENKKVKKTQGVDQKVVEKSKNAINSLLNQLDEDDGEIKPTYEMKKPQENKSTGLNPNFLPDFQKKLNQKTANSNEKSDSTIVMEIPFDVNMSSSVDSNIAYAGREIKTTQSGMTVLQTDQSGETR